MTDHWCSPSVDRAPASCRGDGLPTSSDRTSRTALPDSRGSMSQETETRRRAPNTSLDQASDERLDGIVIARRAHELDHSIEVRQTRHRAISAEHEEAWSSDHVAFMTTMWSSSGGFPLREDAWRGHEGRVPPPRTNTLATRRGAVQVVPPGQSEVTNTPFARRTGNTHRPREAAAAPNGNALRLRGTRAALHTKAIDLAKHERRPRGSVGNRAKHRPCSPRTPHDRVKHWPCSPRTPRDRAKHRRRSPRLVCVRAEHRPC